MTRRRRTPKVVNQLKLQLAQIIQDTFDNNGPVITHDQLAQEHVAYNKSTTAAEDVHLYGPLAVAYLRTELKYAIVPITARFDDYTGDPEDQLAIVNAVAGLGAGGPRIGWYHPSGQDDWLWVYYIGHLGKSGFRAIYHAGDQVRGNPALTSATGVRQIASRSVAGLSPAADGERKMIEARLGD